MYLRFCGIFSFAVALLMVLVGGMNYFIDPYDVWFAYRVPGINMFSPTSDRMERLAKPINYRLLKDKPKVVFVGASQVLWGIDTSYYQSLDGRTTYNMAMPGMTSYEARRYVKHMLETNSHLEEIILGIDFGMLVTNDASQMKTDMDEFEGTCIGQSRLPVDGVVKTMFSFQAFKDSLKKLFANYENKWQCYFHELSGDLSDEAVLFLLQQAKAEFDFSFHQLKRQGRVFDCYINEQGLEDLEQIIKMCDSRDVKLMIFIPPVYADQMILQSVSSDAYNKALRKLVKDKPVLDFSAYNDLTMSYAKPGGIENDTNPYFWDVVHCKKSYGNIIINRLLDKNKIIDAYGVWVDSENVEKHILDLRKGTEKWLEKHPGIVDKVYADESAF